MLISRAILLNPLQWSDEANIITDYLEKHMHLEPTEMFQFEVEEMINIEKQNAIQSIVLLMKQMDITISEINKELIQDNYYFRNKFDKIYQDIFSNFT